MEGIKLLAFLRCTYPEYLSMFLQIISSYIKTTCTRKRRARMKYKLPSNFNDTSDPTFSEDIIAKSTQTSKKNYAFGMTESASPCLFNPDCRYLKSYSENLLLNTTRGINVQPECKRLKNIPRISEV